MLLVGGDWDLNLSALSDLTWRHWEFETTRLSSYIGALAQPARREIGAGERGDRLKKEKNIEGRWGDKSIGETG